MTRAVVFRFMRTMWNVSKGRPALSLLLNILVGLTEGISLMLLIPLVTLAAPETSASVKELPIVGGWLAQIRFELGWVLAIFLFLVLFQALLQRWKVTYNQMMLMQIGEDLRITLFKTVSMSRWEMISSSRTGDLNHSLTKDVDRIVSACSSALGLAQTAFMLAIYTALAFLVSWQMALFAIMAGGVLFLILFPIRRRASQHGETLVNLYQEQNHTVLEFISGLRIAKLFTAEEREVSRYRGNLTQMRRKVMEYISFSTWGNVAFQVGVALIAAGFIWLSLTIFKLDLARLALLIVLFARLAPRFLVMQQNVQTLLGDIPAFDNFVATQERYHKATETLTSEKATPLLLRDRLRIESVSLTYDGADAPSLVGIDAEIVAGEITALIGNSGSGKSTLADVVQGLIRPTAGLLYVDEEPITDATRRHWRKSIASVPQDPFLFNDTIAANLRLARPKASEQELWDALERANIAELIRSLPEGMMTHAQERGTRFSGGERQRLALARAILKRPQLLVLDEATSALDWENQKLVAAAIDDLRGKTTILTIAHRPSLIAVADTVISLSHGKVIEHGSYVTLSKKPNSTVAQLLAAESIPLPGKPQSF